MINELIKLMQNQEMDLSELLELLKTQYNMIMSKDAFGLEGLVDKINECGKRIAKEEVERRNLIDNKNMKNIINECNNEEAKKLYKMIQDTLNETIAQKETNELVLKQRIVFNNKMLELMTPRKEVKTYNSYGDLRK